MRASGVSLYFNCNDVSYVGRDHNVTIKKLSNNVVDSVDEDSRYMYSTYIYADLSTLAICHPSGCTSALITTITAICSLGHGLLHLSCSA